MKVHLYIALGERCLELISHDPTEMGLARHLELLL